MKYRICIFLSLAVTTYIIARNPFAYAQQPKQRVPQQKKQQEVLAEACIADGKTCLFCTGVTDGAFDDAENMRIIPQLQE